PGHQPTSSTAYQPPRWCYLGSRGAANQSFSLAKNGSIPTSSTKATAPTEENNVTHIKPEPVDEEEKFGPRNVTRIKPEPVDEEEKFRPRNVKRIKSEPVDKSEQCSDSE